MTKRWLNGIEAAKALEMSPGTFYKLKNEGVIREHRLTPNSRPKYDAVELSNITGHNLNLEVLNAP